MPKFRRLSAKAFDPKLTLRVQNTGKIGFKDEVTNNLGLNESTYIFIDVDDETTVKKLYMTVKREQDKDAFQVKKAGKYYYLATQRLFDSLNVDYKSKTVLYDLVRMSEYDDELGGEVYRMDYREKPKASASDDDDIDNGDVVDGD